MIKRYTHVSSAHIKCSRHLCTNRVVCHRSNVHKERNILSRSLSWSLERSSPNLGYYRCNSLKIHQLAIIDLGIQGWCRLRWWACVSLQQCMCVQRIIMRWTCLRRAAYMCYGGMSTGHQRQWLFLMLPLVCHRYLMFSRQEWRCEHDELKLTLGTRVADYTSTGKGPCVIFVGVFLLRFNNFQMAQVSLASSVISAEYWWSTMLRWSSNMTGIELTLTSRHSSSPFWALSFWSGALERVWRAKTRHVR